MEAVVSDVHSLLVSRARGRCADGRGVVSGGMARRRWAVALVVVVGTLVALLVVLLRSEGPGGGERSVGSGPAIDGVTRGPGEAARVPALRTRTELDGGPSAPGKAAAAGGEVVARFGWGSGEGRLGRSRPQEGNPEGPMSLTTGRNGAVVVLDQVNQRMVRLDRNGKVLGTTSLPVQAAQDVVLAKDGTAVVLDRLADRSLAIIGPDGAIKGELALVGKGLPEGGAATGVFLDGDDVYVEREHGDLVRAGTTAGVNDPLRPEVPGRPTRDGRTFLSATLVDRAGGTLTVTAIDRPSREHRFTRQYGLGHPAVALVLLDADAAGTFYVGALQEAGAGALAELLHRGALPRWARRARGGPRRAAGEHRPRRDLPRADRAGRGRRAVPLPDTGGSGAAPGRVHAVRWQRCPGLRGRRRASSSGW